MEFKTKKEVYDKMNYYTQKRSGCKGGSHDYNLYTTAIECMKLELENWRD